MTDRWRLYKTYNLSNKRGFSIEEFNSLTQEFALVSEQIERIEDELQVCAYSMPTWPQSQIKLYTNHPLLLSRDSRVAWCHTSRIWPISIVHKILSLCNKCGLLLAVFPSTCMSSKGFMPSDAITASKFLWKIGISVIIIKLFKNFRYSVTTDGGRSL